MSQQDPRITKVSFEEIAEFSHLDLHSPPIIGSDGGEIPEDVDLVFIYNVISGKIMPVRMSTFFDGHIVIDQLVNATLDADVTSNHTIGSLPAGTLFPKGMTMTDAFKQLLQVASDPVVTVVTVPNVIDVWRTNSITLVGTYVQNTAGALLTVDGWDVNGTSDPSIANSLTPGIVSLTSSVEEVTTYKVNISYAEGTLTPAGTTFGENTVTARFPTFFGTSVDTLGSDVDAARLEAILVSATGGYTTTSTNIDTTGYVEVKHDNYAGQGSKYHWVAIEENHGPLINWVDVSFPLNNGTLADNYNSKIVIFRGIRYIVYTTKVATEFDNPLNYTV